MLTRVILRYRGITFLSIVGALIWMAMVVLIPWLVGRVIDGVVSGPGMSDVWPLLGMLLVAGMIQAVGISIRRYFGFKLSYRAEADLRNDMFTHIQRLAFSFHDSTSTGELMARASSDLSQLRLILAMAPLTAANLVMFVVVSGVLIVIDPVLGLAASAMVPALLITSGRYASKVVGYSFDLQQRLSELSQVVEETIVGIEIVKSYGQEAQHQSRLEGKAETIYDASMGMARKRAIYRPLFEIIPAMGTVVVLALGGIRVVDGDISFGEFVAFTQYLAVMVLPLLITGWFFANLPRAAAAASRIDELLETAPEIREPDEPERLRAGPGEVRFEHVSFSYPDSTAVLTDVSFVIPGGTSVGLVGVTGSGKSTIAHLIPRFYDVSGGVITIDGVDIRQLALDELRGEVSVVFQESYLFSVSIEENIRVGDPIASDDRVRSAARLAKAHDFICDFPDGYKTVVGERGSTLSGGQRQRVSLARGVVRDPRVLILDDATSSVDAIVEAEIQAALRQVMAGRTTVIIAHRMSTLALVDNVAFIENGSLVAFGPHDELLATVPRYAQVLAAEVGTGV